MRRWLLITVAVIGACALIGVVVWWPGGDPDLDRDALGFADRVKATVTSSHTGACAGTVPDPSVDPGAGAEVLDAPQCIKVTAEITSGDRAGETATLEASADFESPVSRLGEGDAIVLNDAGDEVPPEARYSFADKQRSTPLVVLAVVFAVVVVALGRLRGLLGLAGIALSLGVLLVFIFPALLDGASPVGVAWTGAVVIAFGTLYLAHGVNDRTTVALLGTMASLV